jgi:long-chain acyl-CoA synthetase
MLKVPTTYRIDKLVTPEGHTEWVYADRPRNLTELLKNTVSKYADREGPMDENARLTYRQFASSVSNVAAALYHHYGIRKGDRVALMLRNGLEFATSLFAIARIGAITVPLNTGLRGEEMAYQLKDSGAVLLIIEPEFHELLAEASSGIEGVKHIFVTGGEPPAGTIAFSELLKDKGHAPAAVEVEVGETDSAVIMYTSGTTGRPKGALLPHKGVIASAMNVSQLYGWRAERDRMLIVVPLFHITGLAQALGSSIYTGNPVVLAKRFKAVDTLKIIEEEKITTMIAVPTIFWLMLNAPEFDQYNLSSLRFLATGGAPVPEDLIKLCAEKLPGVEIAPGYGLTEANGMCHTTLTTDEALSKPGSVGRAVPILDAKVVDSSGRDLPPGETGELLVKGCQTLKEYWNKPEATRETIVDGWVHTGDVGMIAEDGYTYIFDRLKDMIIRGGENIYSIEIENVLYQNPKILEAAVVGVPDTVFGEQVKAALVLRPGEQATVEEIQEFCGKHLAYYKVPKYIEFRESLPRNPAGKVIKGDLK